MIIVFPRRGIVKDFFYIFLTMWDFCYIVEMSEKRWENER
nr:MAG TPA: hypothetical protein [Caudoviricetes sp.]